MNCSWPVVDLPLTEVIPRKVPHPCGWPCGDPDISLLLLWLDLASVHQFPDSAGVERMVSAYSFCVGSGGA